MNKKYKILVIDDDLDFSEVIKYLLEKNGPYEVTVENESTRSISTIYKVHPDLILLDVTMPNLNGYEVCRQLKSDGNIHFVKVLFVSGNVSKEERLRGYECGADDYITKPFDNEEFLAKINVFLHLKSTEELQKIQANLLNLLEDDSPWPLQKMFSFFSAMDKKLDMDHQLEFKQSFSEGITDFGTYTQNTLFLCKLRGGIKIVKKSLLIDKSFSHAIHKLHAERTKKKVTFSIEEKGKRRAGEIDEDLITKAFHCILGDVLKYTQPKQDVGIVIDYTHAVRCTVYVQDSGEGIEQEKFDTTAFFDEFRNYDFKHHKRGQDLGLAVARRIAHCFEGDLFFQYDNEGKASVIFHFLFPKPNEQFDAFRY